MGRRSPAGGSRRRRAALAGACGALAVAVLATAERGVAAPADPRLAGVQTWALALGATALSDERLGGFDLVVVDGEETTRGQVRALRRRGALVLGYLSVGTIEPWRPWYEAAKPYRLDRWADWGEWYADASRPGWRELIAGRVAPGLLAKGFDGLFLDNTDLGESHPAEAAGMRALVRRLAALVHGRGGLLFTQNGEDSIGPTLRHDDGWNRESVTWTYDFAGRRYERVAAGETRRARAAVRRLAAAGLLVFTTDYVRAGDRRAVGEAIASACAAGALPYVSGIRLIRLPAEPYRCP